MLKLLLLQAEGTFLQRMREIVNDPFITEILSRSLSFLGKLAGALILLLIGRYIARLVQKIVKRVLERVGVDRLAERLGNIDLFKKAPINFTPSVLIAKFLYYLIFFIFFMVATEVLGIEALSDMIMQIFNYIPSLISAMVVFVVGVLLADFLKNIVATALKSLNIPAGGLIANFVFYFAFVTVVIIALSQTGIDTNFLQNNISIILAGVALAFAIGYGFASRYILSNMLSAYYNRKKIEVGDIISMRNTPDDVIKGEITHIDSTSFVIESKERRVVMPLYKLNTDPYELYPMGRSVNTQDDENNDDQ